MAGRRYSGLRVSNTTLVKVKFYSIVWHFFEFVVSNTTLVKVKFKPAFRKSSTADFEIQHVLKLNSDGKIESKVYYAFEYKNC